MTSAMEEPLLGRLSEKCSAGVRAADRRTSELQRTGTGTLSYAEEEVEQAILSAGADGGHYSGTTRMSARPEDGVVDADCRVDGTDNLHIASTSVLPHVEPGQPDADRHRNGPAPGRSSLWAAALSRGMVEW